MSSKSRKVILGLAVVVAAVFLAALAITMIPASSRPPLPNPNGYGDFLRASESVLGNAGDYPSLERDGLEGLVSTNAEALRLLRLGLTRQCVTPEDLAMTNIAGTLSQLADMKRLVQLLAAEGRWREMNARWGGAAHSYTDAIRFGNEISRGGLLITRLVGVACEAIGGQALAKVIPKLRPEEARAILTELEKVDALRVTWTEVMQNERAYARHQFMKRFNPVLLLGSLLRNRQAIQKARTRHNMVIAHERLLAAELALRIYESEHGRAPMRLDDLVTNYLSAVPKDPFTGQQLIFRPQGTNWLVYSVGSDGVDDGGAPAARGLPTKGDILFNSAW